jgi:very-short-patch-repair endonuclease
VAWDVDALVGPDGWTTRAALLRRVDRGTVDAWVASGRLVRWQPGVYATRSAAREWRTRVAAAACTKGAVVSHASALALWEVLAPPPGAVHLTVGGTRSGRGCAGVVLHRADLRDTLRRVEGIPVTCVERAVVDTWGRPGELRRPVVRAAAIDAVRRRLCRPQELAAELAQRPRLARREELTQLVRLLAQGCRSELEIWGCLQVLQHPGMPAFVQQREVVVAGERFFLDVAYEEVLLAVELDGAAWHGSRQQRERDIRRDALLATAGWQTLLVRLHAADQGARGLPTRRPGHLRGPAPTVRCALRPGSRRQDPASAHTVEAEAQVSRRCRGRRSTAGRSAAAGRPR